MMHALYTTIKVEFTGYEWHNDDDTESIGNYTVIIEAPRVYDLKDKEKGGGRLGLLSITVQWAGQEVVFDRLEESKLENYFSRFNSKAITSEVRQCVDYMKVMASTRIDF